MKYILLVCLGFITWLSEAQEKDTLDWKPLKERDEMMFYVRDVPGTSLNELKLNFVLENTSICEILSIMEDTKEFQSWSYKCLKAESVEIVDEKISYAYYLFDFPWPLQDRELIVRSISEQDPVTRVLTIRSDGIAEHPKIAVDPGVVRISDHFNEWKFTPLQDGRVRVDYLIRSAPGGSIPIWAVNAAIDLGPYNSMMAFRQEVARHRYRDKVLACAFTN